MTSPDKVVVNGTTYDVIVREPARVKTAINAEPAVIKTVDMLLLANDQVVYQCAHPDAKPKCEFIADSAQSVTAHQRSHSAKLEAKRAKAELDRVHAEKAAQHGRRSAGVNASNAIKKARHEAEITASDPQVRLIQRSLSDLGVALDREARNIDNIRKLLDSAREQLKDVTAVTVPSGVDVDKLTTEEKFALVKKLMA